MKDEILPKRSDGREQSTVSWEFDFKATEEKIFVRFADLKPTYRGRDKGDVEPLNLKNIKRFGIMMRRYVLRSLFLAWQGGVNAFLVSLVTKKVLLSWGLFPFLACVLIGIRLMLDWFILMRRMRRFLMRRMLLGDGRDDLDGSHG